jgi:hypothetical protein
MKYYSNISLNNYYNTERRLTYEMMDYYNNNFV